MNSKGISIIIPTYNERENLPIVLGRIKKSLVNHDHELIVVDDNSPDGTGEVAEDLSKEYHIKVIHREGKKGLASAVIDGFKHAEGKILCVMDADLQHPPEKILALLNEIRAGRDIAIASRYIKNGGIENWNVKRKIISKGAMILAQLLIPKVKSIKDPLSGFFMIRRDVVNGVKLNPTGYKILLEILVRGKYSHIVEVPYIFEDRKMGNSNLNIKEYINYLTHLYWLAKAEGEVKRLFRFGLVGVSGIFINEGILYLLTEQVGLYYMISAVFAIQSAILNNFTFNHLWTFKDRREESVSILRRLGRFELVSMGGVAANLIILFILTSLFGIYYLISNLIAIVIAFSVNFSGNNLWTWRTKNIFPRTPR